MEIRERVIMVPVGTELNFGPSEDSDSIVAIKILKIRVVGQLQNGALPVRIVGEEDTTYYFHQPELTCRL